MAICISLPFPVGKDEDVCSINGAGAANKYMISTYSLPEIDRLSAGRRRGLYLPGRGGRLLRSVRRRTVLQKHRGEFPGFDKPVPKGQIICSCPITTSTGANAQSYQILGPYPCDNSFFKYCKGATATSKTGSTIYIGAPVGTAAALAVQLNGQVPPLNECSPAGAVGR